MSSDDESANNEPMISDNEQLINEVVEVEQELQNREETEEVLKDEGGEDENDDKKTVKPKRIIRNPQPKLNAETLKGPKGIAALESYFQRVKFKGKGHEQQDLDVILKTYEYWCHRLFPKFPFDTCIERLEKLGSKKAVQTHIKRIRFDLLVEDKPIIDDSDEEPNVEGFVDIENNEINQQQNAQFDQLLSSSAPVLNNKPIELTNEQLERIRLNKERAARLKQERLEKIRDKASENLQVSSQLPGTSGLHSESGLEQFENTQSDVFSQESHVSTLEQPISDSNILFDHESTVKGKSSITGSSIKKKSSAVLNTFSESSEDENMEPTNGNEKTEMSTSIKKKSSAVLNTSSESSEDENMEHTNEKEETDILTNRVLTTSKLLDIKQNSSDTNFTHKRENKGKNIANRIRKQSSQRSAVLHTSSESSEDENMEHTDGNEKTEMSSNLKKKSSAALNTSSESSEDENMEHTNGNKESHMSTDMVSTTSKLPDIKQNASDTNFIHTRENKGKNIANSIKKKSSKRSAVLNTSSEGSEDENMEHINGNEKKEMSTNMASSTSKLVDIEQNSSDSITNVEKMERRKLKEM